MATILYVEDHDLVREINTEIFQIEGHKVLVAENGKKALELFEEHQNQISVVFTDLDMPYMTGDELVSEIRKRQNDLPVYVVTGADDPDRLTKVLLKGATAHFTKPVSVKKLIEYIPAMV